MLEKKADEKWGGQEDYEAYKARTPVLIPRVVLPRSEQE
jgi:protein-S-isoprenylcysteine O-methyltransferase Ste14